MLYCSHRLLAPLTSVPRRQPIGLFRFPQSFSATIELNRAKDLCTANRPGNDDSANFTGMSQLSYPIDSRQAGHQAGLSSTQDRLVSGCGYRGTNAVPVLLGAVDGDIDTHEVVGLISVSMLFRWSSYSSLLESL